MKEIMKKLNLGERSCQFILANEELCNRILKEQPVRLNDAAYKYNISPVRIRHYVKSGMLSSFSNTDTKGSPTFVFEEELISLFGKEVHKRNPHSVSMMVLKTFELYLPLIEPVVIARDYQIIKSLILDRKTVSEISREYDLTRERVRQLFQRGVRRGLKYFAQIPDYQKLKDEIITLKAEKDLLQKIILEIKKECGDDPRLISADNKIHRLRVIDLDISMRALNCLRAADIEFLGELVSFSRNDLLKFRHVGKKTLAELDELIDLHGLKWNEKSKY